MGYLILILVLIGLGVLAYFVVPKIFAEREAKRLAKAEKEKAMLEALKKRQEGKPSNK